MKLEVKDSIVRTILPRRNIDSVDADIVTWYDRPMIEQNIEGIGIDGRKQVAWDINRIASSWFTKNQDDIDEDAKKTAFERVYEFEDSLLINGCLSLDLLGVRDTKSIRHNLTAAIREFAPCIVISSSKMLNPRIDGVDAIYCSEVKKKEYYIITKRDLDPMVAEFVISSDIKEGEPHLSRARPEEPDKSWVHTLAEWVAIELHDIDKFIKVTKV